MGGSLRVRKVIGGAHQHRHLSHTAPDCLAALRRANPRHSITTAIVQRERPQSHLACSRCPHSCCAICCMPNVHNCPPTWRLSSCTAVDTQCYVMPPTSWLELVSQPSPPACRQAFCTNGLHLRSIRGPMDHGERLQFLLVSSEYAVGHGGLENCAIGSSNL